MLYELRPHQQTALNELRISFGQGKKRPMLYASVGYGKTVVAAHIVTGVLDKGKKVLFVAPYTALINQTARKVMRLAGTPQAETTEGKLIGFWDKNKNAHVIVEEDSMPDTPRAISPVVTIYLNGVTKDQVTCDKTFSFVDICSDYIKIRVNLEADECAFFTIKKP